MYRQKSPTYLVVSGQSAHTIRKRLANLYHGKYATAPYCPSWAEILRGECSGVKNAEFIHDELEVIFETEPDLVAFVLTMRGA